MEGTRCACVTIPFMTPDECDSTILNVVNAVAPALAKVGEPIAAGTAETVRNMIQSNERGVALEILCANLFEYGVRVDDRSLTSLAAAGRSMGLDPRLWADLGETSS